MSEPDLQRAGEGPAPARNAGVDLEVLVEKVVSGEFQLETLVERLPGEEGVGGPVAVKGGRRVIDAIADIGRGERRLDVVEFVDVARVLSLAPEALVAQIAAN